MAESEVFTVACQTLESASTLDKLEARGTIRLALKSSGLDANLIAADQMRVVIDKVLPAELVARGVDDADAVCAAVKGAISGLASTGPADSPETVFARLGG